MKKKILLVLAIISLLVCMLAVSVSAQRVEDYNDTFTLRDSSSIVHYQKWFYTADSTKYVRKAYTDTVTLSYVDENGNPITEVAMWEYDEEDDKYYSLVWYISDYELTWEDQTYTDDNVGTQTYPKYTTAKYTLSKVRALDLRYYTYDGNRSNSSVPTWTENRTLKVLEGIYLPAGDPNNTEDDIKLQDAVGIGRDSDNYGYFGYDAQFEATGNKIVVGNFRDCDFQCDMEGNYGTSNTWSRADNLQCLWYPDTMLHIVGGIGSVSEVDFGDGMEIIACQILRENKRVKEIVIPNSVLYLNNEAFRGTDLTKLTVGEKLITCPGNNAFLYTGGADILVISKNLLTTYTNKISELIANTSATIYFDGNLEQATALMERIVSENSSYTSKITLVDYKTTQERGDVKNVCLFYNYNRCEAFYRSQHDDKETLEYHDAIYLSKADLCTTCDRCSSKTVKETYDQLFTSIGYSYSSNAVLQGFAINKSVIDKYKAYYNTDIEFGLVAAISDKVTNGEILNATNKASVDFTKKDYDIFEMKISNISDANKEKSFFLCAYVTIGDETYYLNKNTSSTDATDFAITYNSVSKDAESTQITK